MQISRSITLATVATLVIVADLGRAGAVPAPHAWTEEQASRSWVQTDDETWYQGGVSIQTMGVSSELVDDDALSLRVHDEGTEVELTALDNFAQAKSLADSTAKMTRKQHYATSPLAINTSTTNLKVVGVQWTVIDHDSDGEAVPTWFGSGYITDGKHYCWTTFYVRRPSRNEANFGIAQHIINRVKFGVMHPDPEAVKNYTLYPNGGGRKK